MSTLARAPSWYEATAHARPELPSLDGDERCDVCVVGGGYTGLTAALELAQRGYSVILLEGGRVGAGASGRNGGQIVTGYNKSFAQIARWFGPDDAKRLWDMSEEAKAIIRERVERHAIDCDLKWGYFYGAVKPRQIEELKEYQEELESLGYQGDRFVDRESVRDYVGADAYLAGLYDAGGGHLHPLNYALGLARAARDAGVRIFENSAVTRLETEAAPVAHTARGSVRAAHMVLAGNALFNLVPEMRRRIMPVGTYMIATEPLGENRAKALIPSDAAVADVNFVLNYYRRTSDHRLLFGGGVSYSGIDGPALGPRLRREMLKIYPHLADARVEYCWGGWVDISVNRMPHAGRIGPATYYAQGFSGHGVALTGLLGRLMAEAIAGTAERFDVFARMPKPIFPGGPLRTPALVLAMLWYRLRDML